jgi:hypothetical protein
MGHIVSSRFPNGLSASVETGCGLTTLFFSQVSQKHTSFTLGGNIDDSLTRVRSSPLLKAETVQFVEGPSQLTLPAHKWETKVDIALIDGAHAYPFPELDYFYMYPQVNTWGFLIVDDIQIPTIRRLYDFLREDEMFYEFAVVSTTAFFLRTDAKTFNPYGDNWPDQKYNATRMVGKI